MPRKEKMINGGNKKTSDNWQFEEILSAVFYRGVGFQNSQFLKILKRYVLVIGKLLKS